MERNGMEHRRSGGGVNQDLCEQVSIKDSGDGWGKETS